jgi:hypothetical protein
MWRNPRCGYAQGADQRTEEACQKWILSGLRAKEDNERGKMKDLCLINLMLFIIMICSIMIATDCRVLVHETIKTRFLLERICYKIERMEK